MQPSKTYIHFTLTGDRVKQKLLRYCLTRFPEHQIYHGSVWSGYCFPFDRYTGCHVLIFFEWEGKENKALINLGYSFSNDYGTLVRYPLPRPTKEYTAFESWAAKWLLNISPSEMGAFPVFTERDLL